MPRATSPLRVLDLCAGIGGMSLGLEATGGFVTRAMAEIDPYCRAVLARHWPDVPIHGDISDLDGNDYAGSVDIISAGYPCQPFSVAGLRCGAEDDRHLWPEILRITAAARPTWALFENVAGHVSMGLDDVLSDLADAGYTAAPVIVPACAVNAPHRRDRVWVLAHANRQPARDASAGTHHTDRRSPGPAQHDGQSGACRVSRGSRRVAAATCRQRRGAPRRQTHGGWDVEPALGRVAHGVPGRVGRLKALGNSVVPQIVTEIGYAILEAHEQ